MNQSRLTRVGRRFVASAAAEPPSKDQVVHAPIKLIDRISAAVFGSSSPSRVSTTLKDPLPSKSRSEPSWNEAVAAAEKLVISESGSIINPRELLGKDLSLLTENVRRLLGSGHPVLSSISNYYFQAQGKHIRPMLVLLVAQATNVLHKKIDHRIGDDEIDKPLTRSSDVTFFRRSIMDSSPSSLLPILPAQRRLAEITEMIHTASLLHDDVIDVSMQRRAKPSANAEYGNKMAILAGDFLLARASVALARLRNLEVVELLSTVIANLVEGEFMQLRNSQLAKNDDGTMKTLTRFEYYMEKTYMKTASLIAKSCKAAAVLGGCTPEVTEAVYLYGKNLGLAFQLVDDMLDFVTSADEFGKPVNADLKLGLATAPVLYASETYPQLLPAIERQFNQDGDVDMALRLVHESDGIQRTRELAASYCSQAVEAISVLPPSPARQALIQLTQSVLTRKT
ncbi:coq1 putative hexaprenyl diphosphate synthase [Blyttiomyces sp. JEL0837]|nr:coq1 putative hexaprenyl diphosphate synthase [Blyttiomyces sp. JEL0837]